MSLSACPADRGKTMSTRCRSEKDEGGSERGDGEYEDDDGQQHWKCLRVAVIVPRISGAASPILSLLLLPCFRPYAAQRSQN